MDSTIEYSTLGDGQILYKEYKGVVTIETIINSWKPFLEDKGFDEKYKGVIGNFSKCKIDFNEDFLSEITLFLEKNKDRLKEIKMATIGDSPKITFALRAQIENPSYAITPFATLQAAIDWILDQ
jgi:hypothetical protein